MTYSVGGAPVAGARQVKVSVPFTSVARSSRGGPGEIAICSKSRRATNASPPPRAACCRTPAVRGQSNAVVPPATTVSSSAAEAMSRITSVPRPPNQVESTSVPFGRKRVTNPSVVFCAAAKSVLVAHVAIASDETPGPRVERKKQDSQELDATSQLSLLAGGNRILVLLR